MEPTGTEIPEKRYFKIGEVSTITGIKPYVLRYWETEFSKIKPAKSRAGQRLYKKQDIEIILQVKDLLYNRKFTIAGARKALQAPQEPLRPTNDSQAITLEQVRDELLAIRDLLS